MTLPSTNRKRLFGYSSRIVPCPRPVVMRLLTDIHSVTVGRYTSPLVHSLRASMIQKKWSLTDFFVLATLVLPVKSERRSPLRSHTKRAKKCPFNDEYLFFLHSISRVSAEELIAGTKLAQRSATNHRDVQSLSSTSHPLDRKSFR